MLGRLAKWLRLMGFDTVYYRDISDTGLIRIAMEEDRIILTRDTRLVIRKGLKQYLLIQANDTFSQLSEVIKTFSLNNFNLPVRCIDCNGLIHEVAKFEVRDFVPEFVFLQNRAFLKCADCGKIYWEGTHPAHFRKKLEEILKR